MIGVGLRYSHMFINVTFFKCVKKIYFFFQQFGKKTPAHSLVQSSIWHPLNDAMLFCKVICPSKIFVVHSKFFFELGRLETIRASSCRGPSPATMQDDATPISMYLTVFFTFFYILHTCFLKKFKKKIRKLKKILPLLISGGIRPKCSMGWRPQCLSRGSVNSWKFDKK